jgi:hypothetical protein
MQWRERDGRGKGEKLGFRVEIGKYTGGMDAFEA